MSPLRISTLTVGLALCLACNAETEGGAATVLAAHPLLPPYTTKVLLRKGGGRVDWSAASNIIAYDSLNANRYDIHTMTVEGKHIACLTCARVGLPLRHIGQPAWHPSGRYLVMQVEKAEHAKTKLPHVTQPGAGAYNDLWLLEIASGTAYPIHEVTNAVDFGVLHPHFSADGRRLSWSEKYRSGSLQGGFEEAYWKLMVADFVEDPAGCRLENLQAMVPGAEGFYENHGFSPDGTRLIFTSNFVKRRPLYLQNIYTYHLDTQRSTRLTDADYNEHALFSPSGDEIAWITNRDVPKIETGFGRGTDYWLMDSDGSEKTRLTYFNTVTFSPEQGKMFVASDLSWSPDGKRFVGYVQAVSDAVDLVTHANWEEWIVQVTVREL